jgi:hypothetical protein
LVWVCCDQRRDLRGGRHDYVRRIGLASSTKETKQNKSQFTLFSVGVRVQEEERRQNCLYQFIILHCPRAAELVEPPPPALESPTLHFFVRHKLQGAVAHAHQRERRATVKSAQTLLTI